MNHLDEHDHVHESTHSDEEFSLKETKLLLKYMIAHNSSHNKEIIELAQKLNKNGYIDEYHNILKAIDDYNAGNEKLAKTLEQLEK